MTQNDGTYPTGTYVKDGREKVANSARAAVKLAFEGYTLKEEPAVEPETAEEQDVDTEFGDNLPVRSFPTPSDLFD